MRCLHCDIVDLIAQHVTEAEGRGEKVDVLPVAYAVAKALGQIVASAETAPERVRLLFMTATTLRSELAASDLQDRASGPSERVTVGSVH